MKYENLVKRKCKNIREIRKMESTETWNKIRKCKENWKDKRCGNGNKKGNIVGGEKCKNPEGFTMQ